MAIPRGPWPSLSGCVDMKSSQPSKITRPKLIFHIRFSSVHVYFRGGLFPVFSKIRWIYFLDPAQTQSLLFIIVSKQIILHDR